MKTVKLQNFGTIHYGSPEELEEAANSRGIKLPSMKNMKNYLDFGGDRETNLFSVEGKTKEEDMRGMGVILLNKLLCEVSGDDVTEEECFELSKSYYRSMEELREKIA